jgi:hypothetical protein
MKNSEELSLEFQQKQKIMIFNRKRENINVRHQRKVYFKQQKVDQK